MEGKKPAPISVEEHDFVRFVGEVAHDFNNLLVGIVGNANLLLEEGMVSEEGKVFVRQMLSCSKRAYSLTELLARALHDDSGTTNLIPAPTDDEYSLDTDTVLVIDDESVVRTVSASILERAGFRVLTAASGREGIELFEENKERIRCVLLDRTMPYMSGNLVFARLKAIDSSVRVFVMSGFNDKTALKQFDSAGISGFIKKPFMSEDLLSAVGSFTEPKLAVAS